MRLLRWISIMLCLATLSCIDLSLNSDTDWDEDKIIDSGAKEEILREFTSKAWVDISTVSGDCIVTEGAEGMITVHLVHNYTESVFTAEMRGDGDRLILHEQFHGSSQGISRWTVTVPPATRIVYASASGDFGLTGLTSSLTATTASGDISVANTGCTLNVETASGAVSVNRLSGEMVVRTASGDVDARLVEGEIEVHTASGDVAAELIQGTFFIRTASGEVYGRDMGGSIDVRTASGDISLERIMGVFDVTAASGDVAIRDIHLQGVSFFSAVSGNVYIGLDESTVHDLTLSTVTGNATLDYNGNPVTGNFTFIADAQWGEIESPFGFDREETFVEGGTAYQRKIFTRVQDSPRVLVRTTTGAARLLR